MNPKICFVSLGSYPLFTSNEELKYVGGAELKQVLIGKELTKKEFDVTFITYNEEGQIKKEFEKISIIKTYLLAHNYNFFKKAILLWKALKKANSEIYIQSGGAPGIVALYCYLHKKKYIKWLSSDKNVLLEGIENRTSFYTKIALFMDIKLASLIITQNKFQKNLVEKKFKKKSVLIKNPISIPMKINNFKLTKQENVILWVGTIRPIKQPEIFLNIAKMLPRYRFIMIGGKIESESILYEKIREGAKKISNLEFLGFIPHNKIQKYYKDSTIFVNTSKAEGFPNSFLEAWINLKPVVSLDVDPDEVICSYILGFHSKTFKQMILDIECLVNNDSLRYEIAMNARKYIQENHDLKMITNQIIDILISFEN